MKMINCLVFLMLLPEVLIAQPLPCTTGTVKINLEEKTASAGTFANLRGSSDSLKVQSQELINNAISKSGNSDKLRDCKDCDPDKQAKVIFTASPSKYLTEYTDKEKCNTYLKETTDNPIQWRSLKFNTPKEISDYFAELSQGKGEQGKLLYSKCDGDCSPRYKLEILPDGSAFNANIDVICGPARDKDEGMYKLETALAWNCRNKAG